MKLKTSTKFQSAKATNKTAANGFVEEDVTPKKLINGKQFKVQKDLKSLVKKKKRIAETEEVEEQVEAAAVQENGKKKSKKLKLSSKKLPASEDEETSQKKKINGKTNGKSEVEKKKKSKKSNGPTLPDKSKKVIQNHKASLSKLKNIDPEFYKFLEQNDKKLLKFDAENDDADDDDDEEEEEEEKQDESDEDDEDKVHKPTDGFDVASDESDFEGSGDEAEEEEDTMPKAGGRLITLKLLKLWQLELLKDKCHVDTIKNVILAVNSALLSISGEKMAGATYKVEGAAVFNGILQLCVLHLHPAVKRFLGLAGKTSKKAHKCKKWNKIRVSLRDYLTDLTKLLEHISSPNILIVLLKHLHQICPMVASFTNLTKPILKRLVTLWSTADETVRVLAFLCILKITRGQPTSFLNTILKAMYLSYIRNSKFVSPGTLPSINFMRRSLTEMFALDLNVSYQHVFLYIRQLAIHLRNALTLKKKDSYQAVYNWQFINSMRLWAELLSATSNKAQLQPLVYPLVSIVTGVIKLIPTAQFFPLRFHCCQILIQLSKETRNFIPVLPYILEVLNSNTFNKKHSNVSMKPLPFTCILRLNKGQMLENGFRDEVIENIFSLTLDYMAHESYSLSFPDMAVPCIINLKQYLKKCKNSNYSRKIKTLVDKLDESARLVEVEREKITFTLKDASLILAWEQTLRSRGTPLLVFYNNWVKTHINMKKRQAINTDDIADYNLPTIKRKQPGSKVADKNDGPVDLFPSDDEDDQLELEKPIAKKQKRDQPKRPVQPAIEEDDDDDFVDDGIDIVKDLDLDDW